MNEPETICAETTEEIEDNIKFYNCFECNSLIEIISINKKKNTLKYKCLKCLDIKKIAISEYLEKIKRNNAEIENDIKCKIHNKEYVAFCFECNINICIECLSSSSHLYHLKNFISEVQPTQQYLETIE